MKFPIFNRLQDDLMETKEMFQQRREAVEKQCWQCQDLFKPWWVSNDFQKTANFCKHIAKEGSAAEFNIILET